jgi:hypothetical protein
MGSGGEVDGKGSNVRLKRQQRRKKTAAFSRMETYGLCLSWSYSRDTFIDQLGMVLEWIIWVFGSYGL